MKMLLQVPDAKRVSDALFLVVLLVISLSLAGQCSKYLLGHPQVKGLVPAFYVDYEAAVPTWYSSVALGLAAGLLALIAVAKFRTRDRFRLHWASLSALLFLLSADEVAMFHELPIDPLREAYHAGGWLYYPWVIPGLALVGLTAGLYLHFFLVLPARTKKLFLLAAVVFVSGAIGVEMLSGAQADAHGEENLTYAMIITLEEFWEMIGVVIAIRALLEYIRDHLGGLHVQFPAGDSPPTRPLAIR